MKKHMFGVGSMMAGFGAVFLGLGASTPANRVVTCDPKVVWHQDVFLQDGDVSEFTTLQSNLHDVTVVDTNSDGSKTPRQMKCSPGTIKLTVTYVEGPGGTGGGCAAKTDPELIHRGGEVVELYSCRFRPFAVGNWLRWSKDGLLGDVARLPCTDENLVTITPSRANTVGMRVVATLTASDGQTDVTVDHPLLVTWDRPKGGEGKNGK